MERFVKELDEIIKSSQSFLLLPHVNMDGDALGSLLAFSLLLKDMGKEVHIYTNDRIPEAYRFLPGINDVQDYLPDRSFDCAVLFECSSYGRSPANGDFKARKTVNIDHHPDNTFYGTINYVDSTASSVGEIIYSLFSEAGYPFTREMAVNLYVAVFTDTGGFNFNNTTGKTHRIVSEMLEKYDLPLDEISRRVDREMEFNEMLLLGDIYRKIKIYENGLASAVLTRDMMERRGVDESDIQNYTKRIFQLRRIHTMAFLRENSKGKIKVSLRSNKIPVNQIAAKFGGGGHSAAAGCTIRDSGGIRKAEKIIITALKDELRGIKK